MEHLKITGLFSHLCVSDSRASEDVDYTQAQLDRFFTAVDWLRRNGYDPGAVHIQASGGILNLPPQPCDYARAGIALYGAAEGDGPLEIRVEELAWKCGTIPNELLSRLGGRLGVVQLLQSDSW